MRRVRGEECIFEDGRNERGRSVTHITPPAVHAQHTPRPKSLALSFKKKNGCENAKQRTLDSTPSFLSARRLLPTLARYLRVPAGTSPGPTRSWQSSRSRRRCQRPSPQPPHQVPARSEQNVSQLDHKNTDLWQGGLEAGMKQRATKDEQHGYP